MEEIVVIVEGKGEEEEEEEKSSPYSGRREMSSEIVEIVEEDSWQTQSAKDVYVAVGKNDLGALKWAVDHAVVAEARVFLVHVFPPVNYIPTPVGMLSKSQLSQEQVNIHMTEESNKRRNLLQKYIQFCTDAKVTVDTVLVESNETAKSILDLIPVLNITTIVMGAKRPPSSRRLKKGLGKGEFVQKNAPKSCEVTIVYNGNKVVDSPRVLEPVSSSPTTSSRRRSEIAQPPERKFFYCVCFSGKFN